MCIISVIPALRSDEVVSSLRATYDSQNCVVGNDDRALVNCMGPAVVKIVAFKLGSPGRNPVTRSIDLPNYEVRSSTVRTIEELRTNGDVLRDTRLYQKFALWEYSARTEFAQGKMNFFENTNCN